MTRVSHTRVSMVIGFYVTVELRSWVTLLRAFSCCWCSLVCEWRITRISMLLIQVSLWVTYYTHFHAVDAAWFVSDVLHAFSCCWYRLVCEWRITRISMPATELGLWATSHASIDGYDRAWFVSDERGHELARAYYVHTITRRANFKFQHNFSQFGRRSWRRIAKFWITVTLPMLKKPCGARPS
jgi:hypothetical protein